MQDLVNVATLASIYLLFAIGMSLVWGSIGILNLAHASVFACSAFAGYLVLERVSLPIIPVVAICVVVGAALSTLVQIVAFEPILNRAHDMRTAEFQILVGGLGVDAALLAIVQKATTSAPFGFTEGSFAIKTFTWGSIRISNIQLIIIVVGALVATAAALWMRRSRTGLALRAIGIDAETAALMGIKRTRLARLTMTMAGGLAGLAGALLTYNLGSVESTSANALLIKAFAAIILGGVGSVAGVVVGCVTLAFAETMVLTHTAGTWVSAISFGLILLVLLLRPQGIFGRAEVRRT
ncbi:branched-chain amino acid ABC transporter permease [Nocardioides humi]|uniref:Branched-chain amino acid ABC transporter permease n=1 Tax=Nocardioides humi TaxID=449461 RepID=A0ABN1ZX60_9ACTN|nr:branched-chain amino acid ABC transporter permease [Nocardioides humi]